MADQHSARPVSGEIMAVSFVWPAAPQRGSAQDEIHDAEFEELPHRQAEAVTASRPRSSADFVSGGMDMLRTGEPQAPPSRRDAPGGPILWATGIGLALAAFWIAGGHELARRLSIPLPAGTIATLSISDVTSRVDGSGPKPVLIVDGAAGNEGVDAAPLPALAIAVTGRDGRVTRYRLGTSGRPLGPGERMGFSSRLELPTNGVVAVAVSFAD